MALLLWPAVAAAQGRVGPVVHAVTTVHALDVAASLAADGSFVIVWTSVDADALGVFGRRYDAYGVPLTPEFAVNGYTTGGQHSPQVASEPDGDFVVVWEGPDASNSGIFARRFFADGTPIADEFQVNYYTTGIQTEPALAADLDGSFVVAWSAAVAGDPNGVAVRRYDASGTPAALDFRVNTVTTFGQQRASVAMTGGGAFVVVWDSTYGSDVEVYGRRFDASGAPLAPEFRVNQYTTGDQMLAEVAPRRAGGFVVVWRSEGQDGSGYGIFGRAFLASGVGGADVQVNTHTTGDQSMPKVAGDGAGNFTVVWEGEGPGDDQGVFARHYLAPGAPTGPEFAVNPLTTAADTEAGVTMAGNGRFVVTWLSDDPLAPTAGYDALAQLFAPEVIFGDGFDSGTLAAWSASANSGGDVTVSAAAGLAGSSQGLGAVVDDTSGRWVQDDTPDDEDRYRARFYFDPNGFDPGETLDHRRIRLFVAFEEDPTRRLLAVVLRRLDGAYALAGRARLDDDSQHDTGFFPITDDEHFVEIDWRRASGADANDGALEMWIDGTSVYATASLDNSAGGVDFARLGAISAKEAAAGTLYLDEFESRRSTYIGP
jgi:hypothetical protein